MDKIAVNNLVVISDTHCGCSLGLRPKEPFMLDDGDWSSPSKNQEVMWGYWECFWEEWVPMVIRGEPFAVLVNGDSIEGVHHSVKTLITPNFTYQKRLAELVLAPVVEACEGRFFMTRGTEAHVGKSGEDEEALAKSLGAVPDEDGHYARWDAWLGLGRTVGNRAKYLIHAMHHIGVSGSAIYEMTEVKKEFEFACAEAGKWRLPAPDVVVRSHRHRYSMLATPTANVWGISTVTPGWQLRTPLTWRSAGGRLITPEFGGILIRAGDEEVYTRAKVWKVDRTSMVKL